MRLRVRWSCAVRLRVGWGWRGSVGAVGWDRRGGAAPWMWEGVCRRWGKVGRWGRYVCGRGRHCACRRQRRGVHLQARSPVGTAGKAGTLRRAALGVGRGVPGAGPQAEGGWGLAAARA